MTPQTLRADLHLHSDHSGLKHLRFLRMRDCYSPPVEVYQRAKARGMDLVTLTDHDTIDGCLEIRERLDDPPDFFMSEEVETFLPGRALDAHRRLRNLRGAAPRDPEGPRRFRGPRRVSRGAADPVRAEPSLPRLSSGHGRRGVPDPARAAVRSLRDAQRHAVAALPAADRGVDRHSCAVAGRRRATARRAAAMRTRCCRPAGPGPNARPGPRIVPRVARGGPRGRRGRGRAACSRSPATSMRSSSATTRSSSAGRACASSAGSAGRACSSAPATFPSHLIAFPFLCDELEPARQEDRPAAHRGGLARVAEPVEVDAAQVPRWQSRRETAGALSEPRRSPYSVSFGQDPVLEDEAGREALDRR